MEIIIRDSKVQDAKLLAKLHIQIFPGFFLSTLGVSFLTSYYKVVLRHPETICLFAEDIDHQVYGYVLGRANAKGYLKRIVKSAPLSFSIHALRLLFTRPMALIRLIKNLEKRRNDKDVSDDQNYSEIGLIGVVPDYKGLGIGHKLLNEFQNRLKSFGVNYLSLTTDAKNNESTLIAYKSWGFKVYYSFVSYPDREMVRLIKQIN